MSKVVPLFVVDEFTGLNVPNVRQELKPVYVLTSKAGGHKCTEQRGQAIGWLMEAISKSDDPNAYWIEVL